MIMWYRAIQDSQEEENTMLWGLGLVGIAVILVAALFIAPFAPG
jgi:hypothetical protein